MIKATGRVTLFYAACAVLLWCAVFSVLRGIVSDGGVVDMRLDIGQPGVARWYLDRGLGYSDSDSVAATLHAGSNDVRFRLPAGTYTGLRFDPSDSGATVVVRIMNWHLATDHGEFSPDPQSLVPLKNIEKVYPSPNNDGVIVVPTQGTHDPQLSLPLTAPLTLEPTRSLARNIAGATLISAFLVALAYIAHRRIGTRTLIVIGLFLASGLIIGLATMSRVGIAHPDERAHAFVLEYLTEHVLPPAADDVRVRSTLSTFGYSYLFELNVTYWIAARVMAPIAGLFATPESAGRVFQCVLWLVLAFTALRRRRGTVALGVLFLSPQIWYVFAYFNGDAFPLSLAFFSVLLCAHDSGVHRYMEGRASLRSALGLALCLGLLLVSKANYLPLVPAVLLWLAVLHLELGVVALCALLVGFALLGACVFMSGSPAFVNSVLMLAFKIGAVGLLGIGSFAAIRCCLRDDTTRPRFIRMIALTSLVIAFALPRIAQDVSVNGLPASKAAKIQAVEEAYARPDLRPSVIARGQGGEWTGLATQHVALDTMLFDDHYRWVLLTTKTILGVYGYISIVPPSAMYYIQLAIILSCLLIAAFALRLAQPARYVRLLVLAAGTAFLVAESSVLHSWMEAYQPQGRYLLPLFVMLALIVVQAEAKLPRGAFRLLLAAALVESTASFVFIALPAFGAGH